LGEIQLLCIPRALIQKWFEGIHKSPEAAHPGLTKLYRASLLKYYVPNLKQTLAYYLKRCDECQRLKTYPNKKPGELLHHPVGNIGDTYVFDTLGPIVGENNTRLYVHVAVENSTRLS